MAVTADKEGHIFVADFYNNRVQKFTADGRFLVTVGTKGEKPGQLVFPTDVAVDDKSNVYIVDFGNNRIQKYSQEPAR
jgi:DNA-binding beta-propeller fold protein YncE